MSEDATYTVTLTIKDRLVIPNLLPDQGGILSQRIAKDIKKKLTITQDDIQTFEMKETRDSRGQNQIVWDPTKDVGVEMTFTAAEIKMIQEAIRKVDKDEKITQDNLETCEKFLALA